MLATGRVGVYCCSRADKAAATEGNDLDPESPSVAGARTLPDHEQCTRHRNYKLSCEQFEGLLRRSGGSCEICRRPLARARGGNLAIDHCGPLWAVRGLLCNGCNKTLGDGENGWGEGAEYLANTWWKQQCAALGLPLTQRPEPAIGSAIRNQFGIVWVHLSDAWWEARTQRRNHWTRRSWDDLFYFCGPHNLVPYDLADAFRNGSVPSDLRYTVEHARDWSAIRSAVRAPATAGGAP